MSHQLAHLPSSPRSPPFSFSFIASASSAGPTPTCLALSLASTSRSSAVHPAPNQRGLESRPPKLTILPTRRVRGVPAHTHAPYARPTHRSEWLVSPARACTPLGQARSVPMPRYMLRGNERWWHSLANAHQALHRGVTPPPVGAWHDPNAENYLSYLVPADYRGQEAPLGYGYFDFANQLCQNQSATLRRIGVPCPSGFGISPQEIKAEWDAFVAVDVGDELGDDVALWADWGEATELHFTTV